MLAYAVLVCTALNFSMMTFALRHLNASTAMVIPPPPPPPAFAPLLAGLSAVVHREASRMVADGAVPSA